MSDQFIVDQETHKQLEGIATRHPAVARPLDLQVLARAVLAILDIFDYPTHDKHPPGER